MYGIVANGSYFIDLVRGQSRFFPTGEKFEKRMCRIYFPPNAKVSCVVHDSKANRRSMFEKCRCGIDITTTKLPSYVSHHSSNFYSTFTFIGALHKQIDGSSLKRICPLNITSICSCILSVNTQNYVVPFHQGLICENFLIMQ